MGRKRINQIGKKYNHLLVLKLDHIDEKTKQGFYLCQCDCGNKKVIGIDALRNGSTKACGCLRGKRTKWKYKSVEHPKLYKKWLHMKDRCYNKNDISYKNYGARGIKVCDEWIDNFDAFAEWSFINGYSEEKKLEIDRIDFEGDYRPENCRYVSLKENVRNRRITLKFDYKGKKLSLGEIAEINGINYKTLWQRINRDQMSLEEALY